VHLKDFYFTELENKYDLIEEGNKELIDETFKDYKEPQELIRAKQKSKNMYELTNYGELFISACIK
jgi:predicted transcriptional regulator